MCAARSDLLVASRLILGRSPQISDSLKHFGVSATSTALALVHVAPLNGATRDSERSVLERMQSLSGGNPSSLDLLGRLPDGGTNEKSLRKVSGGAVRSPDNLRSRSRRFTSSTASQFSRMSSLHLSGNDKYSISCV